MLFTSEVLFLVLYIAQSFVFSQPINERTAEQLMLVADLSVFQKWSDGGLSQILGWKEADTLLLCSDDKWNWEGIECDKTVNRVGIIKLDGSYYTNGPTTFPETLFTILTELTSISMPNFNLQGPLPSLVHNEKLTFLDLSRNNFQGGIPDDWLKLRQLSTVILVDTGLSGQYLTDRTFAQDVQIDISCNMLKGRSQYFMEPSSCSKCLKGNDNIDKNSNGNASANSISYSSWSNEDGMTNQCRIVDGDSKRIARGIMDGPMKYYILVGVCFFIIGMYSVVSVVRCWRRRDSESLEYDLMDRN